jgi:hypothetical protein
MRSEVDIGSVAKHSSLLRQGALGGGGQEEKEIVTSKGQAGLYRDEITSIALTWAKEQVLGGCCECDQYSGHVCLVNSWSALACCLHYSGGLGGRLSAVNPSGSLAVAAACQAVEWWVPIVMRVARIGTMYPRPAA